MDDGSTDDHTEALDLSVDDDGSGVPGAGARRAPREAAEGVRIIGAEEAAAAIEAGQVAGRRPEDAPRFGDVPEPPAGPRLSLRFPGADPTAVAKPQVSEPPPRPEPPPQAAPVASAPRTVASPGVAEPASYPEPTMGSGSGNDRDFSGVEEHQFWDEPGKTADSEAGPSYVGAAGNEGTGSNPLPHWTEPPSGEVPRILPETEDPAADDDLRAWSSLSTGPRWRDQHTDWDETDFSEEMLESPDVRVGALRSAAAQAEDDADYAPAEQEFTDASPEPAPRQIRRASSGRRPAQPGVGDGTGAPSTPPRDVTTSVVTGVVALAVVLVASAIGPKALLVLVMVALVMAAAELFGAMRVAGHHPATLLGVVGTGALSAAVYWRTDGFAVVLPLFMVFTLLWYLTGVIRGRPLMNAAVTVLGFFYVGVLGSFAAILLTAPSNHGIGLLLGAVLTTAAYDAGAFFAGRFAGRTPLAPDISPGKTVEGMVGACFATLVAGLVVGQVAPWTMSRGILLAFVVMVAAPLGDLCESMLKRDLGVKDMGTILPGHGGILDRIDALLFVVPATYYLTRVLEFS